MNALQKVSEVINKIKKYIGIASKLLTWFSSCINSFPDFTEEEKPGKVDAK